MKKIKKLVKRCWIVVGEDTGGWVDWCSITGAIKDSGGEITECEGTGSVDFNNIENYFKSWGFNDSQIAVINSFIKDNY